MTDYYVSTKKSLLDREKICSLLQGCFWSKNIPLEYVNRFIKYSLCFGVYQKEDNQLVGFGRAISDYTTYAYLCDGIIDPAHRNKGLANLLLQEMLAHPDLRGLKTWSLRATDESRALYEKNNFQLAAYPETILEINDLDIYSHPHFNNIHINEKDE